MKNKKVKIVVAIAVVFICLLAWLIASLQTRSDIESFVLRLSSISRKDVEINMERGTMSKEAVQEYAKKEYFKEIILSQLNNFQATNNKDSIEDAVRLKNNLTTLGYEDQDVEDAFYNCLANKMMYYQSQDNFDGVSYIISVLNKEGINHPAIKDLFQTILKEMQSDIFAGTSKTAISKYITNVNDRLAESEYVSILECYPYDQMMSYIEENGELVICEGGLGGYYDARKDDEYVDESFWYDPLGQKKLTEGEVGTYQVTTQHMFAGDFMVRINSRYWYMTDRNDSNNYLEARLFYKNESVSTDYAEITKFLSMINNENCYYVLSGEDDVFFVLGNDTITIMTGWTLFSIQYS